MRVMSDMLLPGDLIILTRRFAEDTLFNRKGDIYQEVTYLILDERSSFRKFRNYVDDVMNVDEICPMPWKTISEIEELMRAPDGIEPLTLTKLLLIRSE
jgi:hypothetical protein